MILMVGLVSCSSDDDYCGNDFYETYQLRPQGFDPTRFEIEGLSGDSFTIIRSEYEFQRRVKGANYYRGAIDWSREDLIIGQIYINRFRNVINTNSIFKETCNYRQDNILDMTINVSEGNYSDYITYHAIVRKLYNENTRVQTNVYFRK